MAYFIIPAAPGTKFVTMVHGEKREHWVKVENAVIAWRVSDDGGHVMPVGAGGIRDPHDQSEPWVQHPDGTVERPGSFEAFESPGHAEEWLSNNCR